MTEEKAVSNQDALNFMVARFRDTKPHASTHLLAGWEDR
jgi:hypothetical protein